MRWIMGKILGSASTECKNLWSRNQSNEGHRVLKSVCACVRAYVCVWCVCVRVHACTLAATGAVMGYNRWGSGGTARTAKKARLGTSMVRRLLPLCCGGQKGV